MTYMLSEVHVPYEDDGLMRCHVMAMLLSSNHQMAYGTSKNLITTMQSMIDRNLSVTSSDDSIFEFNIGTQIHKTAIHLNQ